MGPVALIVILILYLLFVFQWFCMSFLSVLSFWSRYWESLACNLFSAIKEFSWLKRAIPFVFRHKGPTQNSKQRAAKTLTGAHVNKRWFFLSGWKTWWDAIYFTGIIFCSNPAIRRLNGAALNVQLKKKMPTPLS